MLRSNGCPKCQGAMAEGFVPIDKDGMRGISTWIEGAPEKKWYGLKLGRKTRHEIQTWRCGRCGFLESYAK